MKSVRIAARMTVNKSDIRRSWQRTKTSMISRGMEFSRTTALGVISKSEDPTAFLAAFENLPRHLGAGDG